MEKVVDKAESRGRSLYDWLDSHHISSFDGYYNPRRMNFGVLCVLNGGHITPGKGFGTHPRRNMEIIIISLKSRLQHDDSKQNHRTITPNYIQTMNAGTGIYHSEMDSGDTEEVKLLQIWVMSEKLDTPPAYQDYDIRSHLHENELALIVSPDGNASVKMPQQTWFLIGEVEAGKETGYHLHQSHVGVYISLIEGEIKVDSIVFSRHDGMGVYETNSLKIEILEDSHILLMKIPMQGFCTK